MYMKTKDSIWACGATYDITKALFVQTHYNFGFTDTDEKSTVRNLLQQPAPEEFRSAVFFGIQIPVRFLNKIKQPPIIEVAFFALIALLLFS